MRKPKLRFSKLHYDRGSQVSHPGGTERGTIVDIVGEITDTDSGTTDIQYHVIWDENGFAEEWHRNLELHKVEGMIAIGDDGKEKSTT